MKAILGDKGAIAFMCPACKVAHRIWVDTGIGTETNVPIWGWNGSEEKPTFTPSVLVTQDLPGGETRCHSFVTDGKIKYLGDCTHEMKETEVELAEFVL